MSILGEDKFRLIHKRLKCQIELKTLSVGGTSSKPRNHIKGLGNFISQCVILFSMHTHLTFCRRASDHAKKHWVTSNLLDFLSFLLTVDPKLRPSATAVLSHVFLGDRGGSSQKSAFFKSARRKPTSRNASLKFSIKINMDSDKDDENSKHSTNACYLCKQKTMLLQYVNLFVHLSLNRTAFFRCASPECGRYICKKCMANVTGDVGILCAKQHTTICAACRTSLRRSPRNIGKVVCFTFSTNPFARKILVVQRPNYSDTQSKSQKRKRGGRGRGRGRGKGRGKVVGRDVREGQNATSAFVSPPRRRSRRKNARQKPNSRLIEDTEVETRVCDSVFTHVDLTRPLTERT